MAFTVAVGFTAMVKVDGVPVHPLAAGVTVMVAEIVEPVVLVAVKAGIFPVPLALKPIAVLLLVQVKVVPVTGPERVVTGTAVPLQWFCAARALTVGMGLIVALTGLMSTQPEGVVTLI